MNACLGRAGGARALSAWKHGLPQTILLHIFKGVGSKTARIEVSGSPPGMSSALRTLGNV